MMKYSQSFINFKTISLVVALFILIIVILSFMLIPTSAKDEKNITYPKQKAMKQAIDNTFDIDSSQVYERRVGSVESAHAKGVGQLSRRENGHYYTMTAFAIDQHTLITNQHAITNHKEGRMYDMKQYHFESSVTRSDEQTKRFKIEDYHLIPDSDIAILHTKETMKDDVPKIKLGSNNEVKAMQKTGQRIYIAGYPISQHNRLTQAKGYTVATFSNNGVLSTIPTSVGYSGSPLINNKNHVVGIHAFGYPKDGNKLSQKLHSHHIKGGYLFTPEVKKAIQKESR